MNWNLLLFPPGLDLWFLTPSIADFRPLFYTLEGFVVPNMAEFVDKRRILDARKSWEYN
ncbi:MAG TPA: hypothetical protein VFT51_08085 [Bacillales bacterium]|nr:hypothetical protein [Bacillales bacterium]